MDYFNLITLFLLLVPMPLVVLYSAYDYYKEKR